MTNFIERSVYRAEVNAGILVCAYIYYNTLHNKLRLDTTLCLAIFRPFRYARFILQANEYIQVA